MNKSNNDKCKLQKIVELDYLRGISALAVISIHVLGFYSRIEGESTLKIVISYLAKFAIFAVPCFVFISGLVLYKNYFTVNVCSFFKQRFSKILPMYIIFSFFYIILLASFNYSQG
ncbi:acyltransferase family protein [Flavobacterium faecale]